MQMVMTSFLSDFLGLVSNFLMSEPCIYFIGLFMSLFVLQLIGKIIKIGG